jgi:hypothetical protein
MKSVCSKATEKTKGLPLACGCGVKERGSSSQTSLNEPYSPNELCYSTSER